jgi:TPR repeat protein
MLLKQFEIGSSIIKRRSRMRVLVLIALLSVAFIPQARGDLQTGLVALQREQYEAAFIQILPDAEAGDAMAEFFIGTMYWGGLGTQKDTKEAAKWLRRGAERGNAEAQDLLAYLYENGSGIPQDYAQAFNWYQEAAKKGIPRSQHKTGLFYLDGQGVQRDDIEGAKWLRQSAIQGYADSCFGLGILYIRGQGVSRDWTQAYAWLAMAEQAKSETIRAMAAEKRNIIARGLSEEERKQADDLVAIWKSMVSVH